MATTVDQFWNQPGNPWFTPERITNSFLPSFKQTVLQSLNSINISNIHYDASSNFTLPMSNGIMFNKSTINQEYPVPNNFPISKPLSPLLYALTIKRNDLIDYFLKNPDVDKTIATEYGCNTNNIKLLQSIISLSKNKEKVFSVIIQSHNLNLIIELANSNFAEINWSSMTTKDTIFEFIAKSFLVTGEPEKCKRLFDFFLSKGCTPSPNFATIVSTKIWDQLDWSRYLYYENWGSDVNTMLDFYVKYFKSKNLLTKDLNEFFLDALCFFNEYFRTTPTPGFGFTGSRPIYYGFDGNFEIPNNIDWFYIAINHHVENNETTAEEVFKTLLEQPEYGRGPQPVSKNVIIGLQQEYQKFKTRS